VISIMNFMRCSFVIGKESLKSVTILEIGPNFKKLGNQGNIPHLKFLFLTLKVSVNGGPLELITLYKTVDCKYRPVGIYYSQ
jgi:hypothetical protein